MLDSFVDSLFRPAAFEVDFELVSGDQRLTVPDGTSLDSFIEWSYALPESEHPSVLGLPASAATVIATSRGETLLSQLRKMRSIDEGDEMVGAALEQEADVRPAWMRTLLQNCKDWLAALPMVRRSVSLPSRRLL